MYDLNILYLYFARYRNTSILYTLLYTDNLITINATVKRFNGHIHIM